MVSEYQCGSAASAAKGIASEELALSTVSALQIDFNQAFSKYVPSISKYVQRIFEILPLTPIPGREVYGKILIILCRESTGGSGQLGV